MHYEIELSGGPSLKWPTADADLLRAANSHEPLKNRAVLDLEEFDSVTPS